MSDAVQRLIAAAEGSVALPRKNGELVFEAPWESRAFAMAVALTGEVYDWEEFRAELISQIASWESESGPQAEWSYYDRWLAGFEELLLARGILSASELSGRAERIQRLEAHEHDH